MEERYYLDSILKDVANARKEIWKDPVYVVLNLCRVLANEEHSLVLSKEQGGDWGLAHLSPASQGPVEMALRAHQQGGSVMMDENEAGAFLDEVESRMQRLNSNDPVIENFIAWGQAREDVRAMILTSTRAVGNTHLDPFSDYDVIIVARDIRPYLEDESWLGDFGTLLVVYRDPVRVHHGYKKFGRVTQYEQTKIDFTFYPVGLLERIVGKAQRRNRLPDDLDIGYQVLLDKDHLTAGLPAPTYSAYIPTPPEEAEYHQTIELFFHEGTYASKNIWRREMLPAQYFLDTSMKQDNFLRMLEWKVEIEQGWSVKTGVLGKGLQKYLSPRLQAELAATFAGGDWEAMWAAFFRTIDLFRLVAIEVGERLGYAYPYDLDRRMVAYFTKVRNLPPDATRLE